MKIAIDLDGTAFEWPHQFRELVLHFLEGGAEVVFLTAAAGEYEPKDRPYEVARRVSERLGFSDVRIICCESSEKGEWLAENAFDMVIDDNEIKGWQGLHLVPKAAQ